MKRDVKSENYFENVDKVIFANESELPNTIPTISSFVGRDDYLVDLREAYQKGNRCFVLHGTGGVGKTALALRFAGEIKDKYEAKVFVDMQGMSKNPLSARDAMFDIVVRQFGQEVPADIPALQLKNLFVQLAQSQPTLIVLDNAEKKESVEALMQAGACFVVTSRQSFVLAGGKSKQIVKMSPEDARKLLFSIAGEERFEGQAGELANLAGYLPMSLKPLASLLAEDEMETAANLIEKYRNKQALLEEHVPDYYYLSVEETLTVEASFELSYEALPDEMKERWRRLSVFPADFDEPAIAAVLNISADEAKETQKLLRKFNLLEVNPETRRFNLHDLIRAFTDAKLSDDERFQAQFLHAAYYVQVLYFTDEIRANDRENGFLIALMLIDTEWNNITTGQKWAADNTERHNAIARLCCHYSVNDLLSLRLHPREFIVWQTSSLKAAGKINNKIFEGNFSQNLGNAYYRLGEYRKAIEYYGQALNIAREISHRQGEGQCLGNLGNAYGDLGEDRRAIEYYEQALAISRDIGDRLGEGRRLGNLGLSYGNLGDYRKAIEYHEQALASSREIGNRHDEGSVLNNLGLSYGSLGDYRKAIEYQEQSLTIKREIGDRRGEGSSLGNLGLSYRNLGDYPKAIEHHEQALAISREIGDRRGEGVGLGNLGIAYDKLGEYRKAIEYYEQALEISREIGDRQSEGIGLGNLGIAYNRLGEKEKACSLWKEALTIYEAIESPHARTFQKLLEENCPD
jgi:tetratricopeptide (TPR) repeat protein